MSLRDEVRGKCESSGMNPRDSSEKQIPHPLAQVRDDARWFFLLTKALVFPRLSAVDFQLLTALSWLSIFNCHLSTLHRSPAVRTVEASPSPSAATPSQT